MSQTYEENLKISELLENFQKFSADEQNELIASFKRIESGELTDEELEDVVGGYTPAGWGGFGAGGGKNQPKKIAPNNIVAFLAQYKK